VSERSSFPYVVFLAALASSLFQNAAAAELQLTPAIPKVTLKHIAYHAKYDTIAHEIQDDEVALGGFNASQFRQMFDMWARP
jgi:hypothetical protein